MNTTITQNRYSGKKLTREKETYPSWTSGYNILDMPESDNGIGCEFRDEGLTLRDNEVDLNLNPKADDVLSICIVLFMGSIDFSQISLGII